jgi:hypothetical protein
VTDAYVVCFALLGKNLILPRDPFSMGAFEFSRVPDPFPGCENALRTSLSVWEVASPDPIRLRTTIQGTSHRNASQTCRTWAKEAVNLLSSTAFRMATFELSSAGYTFHLKSGTPSPILPPPKPGDFMGVLAMTDNLATHPSHVLNQLLSVAPETYGELGVALRRSTHWHELGRVASDRSEQLLMYWMACETLTRVDQDESLAPKFLAALGLPGGRYLVSLSEKERNALLGHTQYKPWRFKLNGVVEKLRRARNAIAHSGFRDSDLSEFFSEDERLLVRRLFSMLVPRLQALAMNGLALRLDSVASLWENYADTLMFHRTVPIATEAFGTIVYSLSQPANDIDELAT